MKKYIFLILSIFSLFFITDKVNALEFTASDGNTYQVVDAETCRDFIYYTHIKTNSAPIFLDVILYNNGYCSVYYNTFYSSWNDAQLNFYYTNSNLFLSGNGSNRTYYNYQYNISTGQRSSTGATENTFFSSNVFSTTSTNIFSNRNICSDINCNSVYRSANYTYSDIETKYASKVYHTITYYLNNEVYDSYEVEEGSSHTLLEDYSDFNKYTHSFSGWNYDTENIDLTNITSDVEIRGTIEEKEKTPVYLDLDFPIDKNDFYTLLVLQSVLIMLIFLKWCFPFKGGKDLK